MLGGPKRGVGAEGWSGRSRKGRRGLEGKEELGAKEGESMPEGSKWLGLGRGVGAGGLELSESEGELGPKVGSCEGSQRGVGVGESKRSKPKESRRGVAALRKRRRKEERWVSAGWDKEEGFKDNLEIFFYKNLGVWRVIFAVYLEIPYIFVSTTRLYVARVQFRILEHCWVDTTVSLRFKPFLFRLLSFLWSPSICQPATPPMDPAAPPKSNSAPVATTGDDKAIATNTTTLSLPSVSLQKLPNLSDYVPNLTALTNPIDRSTFYHPFPGFYLSSSDIILRHI